MTVHREKAVVVDLDRAAELLARHRRVVVLTGAGVSTASGIPDFRGPQGVWTRDPEAERLSHIQTWLAEPDVRRRVWRQRLDEAPARPSPNVAHHALVELERLGRLELLVTQNTDGLHLEAGHDPDRVVEIHGTNRRVVCLECGHLQPMDDVLQRVAEGDHDPHCERCGGLLKAATVSFGQPLSPRQLARAQEAAAQAELFLAFGSSLTVHPVAELPRVATDAGARLVVANAEPTPFDHVADAVLGDDLVDVLPALIQRLRAS